MSKSLIKKALVFGIIILFIGGLITPIISGNISKNNNIKSVKNIDITNPIQSNSRESHTTSNTDWWPMFRHDPGNTGCTTSIAPNTNQLCWKKKISDMMYSATPVVYNDRLYISTSSYYYDILEQLKITEKTMLEAPDFTEILKDLTTYKEEYNEGVYCLDADTGTELWNYPLYAPNDPLVVDNKIFVTAINISTASSSLYCLDAETGDNIWDKPVGGSVLSPTIGADNKIFLDCFNYYNFTDSLICLDFDGNSIWTYPLPKYEIICYSAPAYYDDKVYFITLDFHSYYQGKLYCLDADTGQYIWSQPIYTLIGYLSSPSPVCKDGKVFAVDFNYYDYSSNLMCFDADTGNLTYKYPIGVYSAVLGTPAISQDSVFIVALDIFSSLSWLYKIFINCTLDWKVMIPSGASPISFCSPVCSANKVIVYSLDYYAYTSNIYCIEIENGNILWSYILDYPTMSNPSIADERAYIADYSGNIYAFEDELKINKISGSILCAKAEIKNKGASDLKNISWNIDVVGGIFDMIDKHTEGNIPTLQGNTSKTVRAFPIFGLGNVEIEVSVSMPGQSPIKKNLNGLVLGLIVIVKS